MPRILAVLLATLLISAGCAFPNFLSFRTDQSQLRQTDPVWLEADPTLRSSDLSARNNHPFQMTERRLTTILRAIRVRSGRGLLQTISSKEPAFSAEELRSLAPLLSQALEKASPRERVAFRLRHPESGAGDTTGSLFVRGPYLHVVLADHPVFNREDPEGASTRDHHIFFEHEEYLVPAGTEGLPRWAESDRTHLSIDYRRLRTDAKIVGTSQADQVQEAQVPQALAPRLQEQVQELTLSNLDLREKIKTLQKELAESRQEVKRLSSELDEAQQALIEKDTELKQLHEQRKPSKEPKRRPPGVLPPGDQRR
jgi:hypothetical protein